MSGHHTLDEIPPGSFYATPKPPNRRKRPPAQSSATPATPASDPPSTQPRLRRPKRTIYEKMSSVLIHITNDFDSLGAFLAVLFHNRDFSVPDPRSVNHKLMVTAFLGGQTPPLTGFAYPSHFFKFLDVGLAWTGSSSFTTERYIPLKKKSVVCFTLMALRY
ncbi:hypothetical protein C8J57DRAFT_1535524 [Mycena rebaudengoi]|nr:hypothetical protein C8J57DRAFT_1535524 [Mycena rebaudengoi]